jgi:glyoxylase-like metal-dependent hydrolase (beta-lactamase superfamily II)
MKCTAILLMCISAIVCVQAQEKHRQSGFYQVQIGEFNVIALSDGTVPVDATELIQNKPAAEIKKILEEVYLENPTETSINCYLITGGNKRILIDTGAGSLFGPSFGGLLVNSLKEAGYQPDDITDILLTHIHKDHSGGLTKDGKAVFTNATIHLDKKELDFWLNGGKTVMASDNSMSASQDNFDEAKKMLAPYLKDGRVKPFSGNQLLFPGLRSVATYGHTPGHNIYVLESKGEKLFFWGDLIHVGAIQFMDSTATIGFDIDKSHALLQRRKAYAQAAKEGHLIAADHLSFPGIGRVRAVKEQFIWVPINYSISGRTK